MVPEALRRPAPWRALLALMLAVVSWFAFAPVHFNDAGLPLDKIRHLAAFGALAWVAGQAFGRAPAVAWRIALALLAYGVFIELVQGQIPGREASAWDVLADALGIGLGLLGARALSVVR